MSILLQFLQLFTITINHNFHFRWKRELFLNLTLFKFDYAHYAHIFLKFEESFWDEEEWLLYAHSRRGYYPMFSPFESHLNKAQLKGNILHAWTLKILQKIRVRSGRNSGHE